MASGKGPSFVTMEILVGIGVILIGTPLHYLFEAAGRLPLAGFFGPVNESAWEHFKLFYWPLLLLSLVEYPFARKKVGSFFLPKFASMIAAFAGMSLFFYVPRALFGGSLFLSIGSFAVGVLLAQLCSVLLSRRPSSSRGEVLGIALIVLLGLAFILLTFFPPHALPWLDLKAGIYGIG
jgi:hypothetical protein